MTTSQQMVSLAKQAIDESDKDLMEMVVYCLETDQEGEINDMARQSIHQLFDK